MPVIPDYIRDILGRFRAAGHESFLVGGCVRDLLMEKTPKDFDITTVARPEEIMGAFPEAKYENEFGTVILPIRTPDGELLDVVEMTTYRSEQGYSDRRHPDQVRFEDNVDKDLERRDFTINALALSLDQGIAHPFAKPVEIGGEKLSLIDLFGGQKDLRKGVIRAVGEPEHRFKEDALRMMRAVRFACQLGFALEDKTARGIRKLAGSLKFIAKERIKDELVKIIASNQAYEGIVRLHDLKLLQYIIPELEEGHEVGQNHHHIYPVLEHNLLTLKHCPSPYWQVRLAALLHDVGKPRSRKVISGKVTFYNHEYVGAKLVAKIMDRLRFPTDDKERVVNLVKNHMFYYQVGEVTPASVRRLIAKVGRENLQDLIDLRVADRLGSGTPKAMPYKLRHLQYMLERVQNDPVSVKMLAINGEDIMKELDIPPGPIIGAILDALLADVIAQPERNTREYLLKRTQELAAMDLEAIREEAKELIEEKRNMDDKEMKRQFKV